VQLLARHLEVNCQYKCLHNFANYAFIYSNLLHRGAILNTTAVRGGGHPPRPPIAPPLHSGPLVVCIMYSISIVCCSFYVWLCLIMCTMHVVVYLICVSVCLIFMCTAMHVVLFICFSRLIVLSVKFWPLTWLSIPTLKTEQQQILHSFSVCLDFFSILFGFC